LIGGLASLIPVVGGIMMVVSTFAIGLLTGGEIAIITGIYATMVLVVFYIWIKPRLFKRRWDNPILTLVLIIALADVFGIIGIILAPPISAIFLIFWNHLVVHRVAAGSAPELSDLKERLAKITETIDAMEEPHPPLINHSLARINKLIATDPGTHDHRCCHHLCGYSPILWVCGLFVDPGGNQFGNPACDRTSSFRHIIR
jgi:predicted PurR-regulated permease PerM